MRAKPIKITDVADEARVSTMTVSRVMNNPDVVSEETRLRVQEAIRRLGFRPNAIARSLKVQRTFALGLVMVDLTDSFFTMVTAGAEAEARRRGYRLMLSSTERNIQVLLLNIGIPIVTTGYHLPHPDLEIVDVDNVDGGYLASRYLLEHGHREIAMISGPRRHKSSRDRLEGYQRALMEYGLRCRTEYLSEGDWKSPSGLKAMRELLRQKLPFTAVFVQSDEMAIGAYRGLHEAGLRIPQDVSVRRHG